MARSRAQARVAEAEPAPRPRTKGSRTRRRLLDAAAAEVARHGIGRASLGAIAADAGLKTGSIYFHFDSKDQLIEEMLEEGLRATLEYFNSGLAAVPSNGTAADHLAAAIHAHATAVHELQDYTLVVLAPLYPGNGDAAAAFRTLRRGYITRWTQIVADAQQDGTLPRSGEPRLLRDLLLGAINSVSLAQREPDEVAHALYGLLGVQPPWPPQTATRGPAEEDRARAADSG